MCYEWYNDRAKVASDTVIGQSSNQAHPDIGAVRHRTFRPKLHVTHPSTPTLTRPHGRPFPEFTALASWLVSGRFSATCVSHAIRLPPPPSPPSHGLETRTGISLVTVQVQIVRASRRFDVLITLHRFNPLGPPAPLLRLRPASIGLQHPLHPDHPWRELDVDKRYVGAKEEGSCGVCGINNRADLILEFFRVADLVRLLLRLEVVVECRDNMAVDLGDRG